MRLTEQNGNILEAMESCFVAQAISGDFVFARGLSKKINHKFKKSNIFPFRYSLADELNNSYRSSASGTSNKGKTIRVGNIFNIIVKDCWKDSVDIAALKSALESLAEQCENLNIETLYMPKICCGKNKLEWDTVRTYIIEAFGDYDIDIVILYTEEKPTIEEVTSERKCELYDKLVSEIERLSETEDDFKANLLRIGFTESEANSEIYYE